MFKTSVYFLGTSFQKIVWNNLKDIPYGETRSYLDQAKGVDLEQLGRNSHNITMS